MNLRDPFADIERELERDSAAFMGEPTGLPLIRFTDWKGDPPERRSAWGDWLPFRQTTMLTGGGGIGKSLFEQCLCSHIALGVPFLGMECEPLNTLYITVEDDADELWRRQAAICDSMGVSLADLDGKLHLASLCGLEAVELARLGDHGQLEATPRWRDLVATVKAKGIRLFAFDNATDAMAGDHNDIHQVAAFVNLLTGLALDIDGVAMILHHPNKSGDDWLGSVAWHNKVRSRLLIEHGDETDPDARAILNPKANYGPTGGRLPFRWHKGAFVREDDLPPDYAAELTQAVRANSENDAFLACLRQREKEGEGRHVSASPGPNYAPSQFEGMAQAKGYKRATLRRAMDRLFSLGKIETHTRRNTAQRRDMTVIREVTQ